jgi:hypothetical protein
VSQTATGGSRSWHRANALLSQSNLVSWSENHLGPAAQHSVPHQPCHLRPQATFVMLVLPQLEPSLFLNLTIPTKWAPAGQSRADHSDSPTTSYQGPALKGLSPEHCVGAPGQRPRAWICLGLSPPPSFIGHLAHSCLTPSPALGRTLFLTSAPTSLRLFFSPLQECKD